MCLAQIVVKLGAAGIDAHGLRDGGDGGRELAPMQLGDPQHVQRVGILRIGRDQALVDFRGLRKPSAAKMLDRTLEIGRRGGHVKYNLEAAGDVGPVPAF